MPQLKRKRAGAKLFIVLLSIFLFLLIFSSAASAVTYGDVNLDGKINVRDVVLVMQHVLALDDPPLTAAQKTAADVNSDGKVDARDVTLIMQKVLGLIDEFPVVTEKLQVSSVTAVNARQIEVVFNRTVTKALAENPVNYEVYKQGAFTVNVFGTAANKAVAALQEDGKTVLMTLNETPTRSILSNGTNFNRVVVRAAVGLDAEYTNSSVAFLDTTPPTFQSVRSIGPGTIELTFSEPVRAETSPITGVTLTRDGTTIPLKLNTADVTFIDSRRQVVIKTDGVNLIAGATYTLSISNIPVNNNLRDYSHPNAVSSYRVVPASRQFVHTAVTTAPSVSAAAINQFKVRLTFDRPVSLTEPGNENNVRFRLNVNTVAAVQKSGADWVAVPGSGGRKYDITYDDPMVTGTNTLYIHYLVDSALNARIVDNWGNVLPNNTAVTFTVPVIVTPHMLSAQVAGTNTVKVTYSRPVTNNGLEPGQYVYYRQSDDTTHSATSLTVSADVVTLAFPPGLGLAANTPYPNDEIRYSESGFAANRTRDQATGGHALSPDEVVGILASD